MAMYRGKNYRDRFLAHDVKIKVKHSKNFRSVHGGCGGDHSLKSWTVHDLFVLVVHEDTLRFKITRSLG